MSLNDRQIKNAKPAEKPFKSNDGKGLYCMSIRAVGSYGGLIFRITENAFNRQISDRITGSSLLY